MDAMRREAHWRANLQVVQQIYPQYVERLSQAQPNYMVMPMENDAFTCEQVNERGRRWLHGPHNPWQAAEGNLQSNEYQKQRLFLIIRPGLGYLPITLYRHLRSGRHAQRMLIIEDRIDLMRLGMELFDWTDVLRSDRTILMLGDNPAGEALHFFQTNPVSLLNPLSVLCGTEWGPEEQEVMSVLQSQLPTMSQTVYQAANGYMGELANHYKVQNKSTHKPKVLFVEPEHDYLAQPIAKGFEHNGCETDFFRANQRLLMFLNAFIWLVYCREHLPDVLVWMNRNTLSPEGEEHLRTLPIKKVLWFLDSPRRVKTSAEELHATDAYFTFDPTYLPYLESLCGKPGTYLPTATGIDPLPGCGPDDTWPEREGPAVGFMGALAVQRYQSVLEYWQQRDPEFVQILDTIIEQFLEDDCQPLEERYLATSGPDRLPFEGFVVLYLEERVTYLKRLRALQRVHDLGLKTYGGAEWGQPDWAFELTECYTGQTPQYREELPHVYYHTKINVNVFHAQCVNSANPRVYDVLAAGGFLLTEYKPILEEEFTLNEHLVCYRSFDELREKTEYYLEHGDEREAIARAGQKFALENCTYQHRAQIILQTLGITEPQS